MIPVRNILLAGAMLALLAGPAWSAGSGGGGGGDLPSASGPSYDPAAEYAKGVAALNAGQAREAERAFTRVVQALPRNAEAWRLLGAANAAQDDHKGARRAYERALKIEPDDIQGRQGLGVALGALKDAKAAEQLDWLRARAEACGGCAEAAALQTAVRAVEAATGAGPAAILDHPLVFASADEGDSAYLAAVALINEQRYDEALESLDRARAAFGPHPDILTYQGFAWRKKGAFDRAESYYRQALAVAPQHRGATEYYGELKVERGDLAGARRMLARLERTCAYGCAEAEELRRWIEAASAPAS
ncbi:MAG: tetratricopeptide repeat protein [Phenylobacterium sp.]|uniref:tetratricopeptide repeat protein n=1 Tax=Phenylobacterium sp. TaxID=1871053 RepID=UPI00391CEB0D